MNVKKVDENGNGLPNAVFGVWDNPECDASDERPLATLTTGADGVSQTYVKDGIKKETTSITLRFFVFALGILYRE